MENTRNLLGADSAEQVRYPLPDDRHGVVKPAEELGYDCLPLGAGGATQPSLDILHTVHELINLVRI